MIFIYNLSLEIEVTLSIKKIQSNFVRNISFYVNEFAYLYPRFYRDPNSEPIDLPNMDTNWPAFDFPALEYKDLSPTMPNKEALKADTCHFWNDFVPKMVTFAGE